jgi:hypothetical protein
MSSPKATLHMLYIQCGKQPKYETTPVFASKENRNGVDGEGNTDYDGNGTGHDSNEVMMMMMMVSAPFLVKPQKIGYSCTLLLPDRPPIISGVFSKKKEAEQDAAQKALQQVLVYYIVFKKTGFLSVHLHLILTYFCVLQGLLFVVIVCGIHKSVFFYYAFCLLLSLNLRHLCHSPEFHSIF